MIELILVLFLLFFLLPLILSIAAMSQVSRLRQDVAVLLTQKQRSAAPASPAVAPQPTATPREPAEAPRQTTITMPEEGKARTAPPPIPPPIPRADPRAAAANASTRTEIALGGRVASFVGIGLLLIGVAFMVGYAITHGWLGPGTRVILGMLCGAGLVTLGHFAEKRDPERLHVLARTLTGGGTAVFYFCIFAAYGVYNLIDATGAGAGLIICAAVALRLALWYRSEIVGVIAVIGAFLMPALIGDPSSSRAFLLIYIAVINIPVILLGVRRHWQTLYNTAFGFTAFYVAVVMTLPRGNAWLHLAFALIYFLQFVCLGLMKLRNEHQAQGRTLDILRLALNSAILLGATYWILEYWKLDQWTGAAFLGMGLIHFALARFAWKWQHAYADELLTLVIGGVTFLTFALPVQLSGVWISLGWAVEGLILCMFALRFRVPLLRSIGFWVGAIGLMKVLLHDPALYVIAPTPFLNARFVIGLIAALLLGVQGHLHGRARARGAVNADDEPAYYAWTGVLLWILFVSDAFWTLGTNHSAAWLLSSAALLLIAGVSALLARSQPAYAGVAFFLFIALPVKLFADLWAFWQVCPAPDRLFFNSPFWGLLILAALTGWSVNVLSDREPFTSRRAPNDYPKWINVCALLAGVLVVTLELYRIPGTWNQALITLWWAVSAVALTVAGLIRQKPFLRYTGLALFGVTTFKVILLDILELDGLARVAAFMATGILLLALSCLYQRASARLLRQAQEQDHPGLA